MSPIYIQISRSKVKVKSQAYSHMSGKGSISVLQITILSQLVGNHLVAKLFIPLCLLVDCSIGQPVHD